MNATNTVVDPDVTGESSCSNINAILDGDWTQRTAVQVFFYSLFTLIFTSALAGNVGIIASICARRKWHVVGNIFLISHPNRRRARFKKLLVI